MGSGFSTPGEEEELLKHSLLCRTIVKEHNYGADGVLDESVSSEEDPEDRDFKDHITDIHASLHNCDKLPYSSRQEYRQKAGDVLVEEKCTEFICTELYDLLSDKRVEEIALKAQLDKLAKQEDTEEEEDSTMKITLETIVLVTSPDCSALACEHVLTHTILLRRLLGRLDKLHQKNSLTLGEEILFREGLALTHNLAVHVAESQDKLKTEQRVDKELTETMTKFFVHCREKPDDEIKLLAVTALACMGETTIRPEDMHFICLNLSMALAERDKSEKRDNSGLRCSVAAMEIALRHLLTVREVPVKTTAKKTSEKYVQAGTGRTIRRKITPRAKNGNRNTQPQQLTTRKESERVKFTENLVQCGAACLLIKGAQSDVSQERKACLESLRLLCTASEACRKEMAADKAFVDILLKLYKEEQHGACHDPATIILLTLCKHQEIDLDDEKGQKGKKGPTKSKTGHVVLSYQWDSKGTMTEIKDFFKKKNISTLMNEGKQPNDQDENDAMVHNIEGASVFIMGITEKYKESRACKREVDYAEVYGIPILPVKLQKDYAPNGWLGCVQGNKLYFEYIGEKWQKTKKLEELLKKVKSLMEEAEEGKQDKSVKVTNEKETNTCNTDRGTKKRRPKHKKSMHSNFLWVSPHSGLHPSHKCTVESGCRHCCYIDQKKETREWAQKYNLHGQSIRSLSKHDLDTLAQWKKEAPTFFYKRIWEDLKMKNMSEVAHFERALSFWQKTQEQEAGTKKGE